MNSDIEWTTYPSEVNQEIIQEFRILHSFNKSRNGNEEIEHITYFSGTFRELSPTGPEYYNK